MDFNSTTPLEDIVLQNLAVWMWRETDIKELTRRNYDFTYNIAVSAPKPLDRLKEIEGRIMERAFIFQMPELLKSKLRGFVRSVGRQMLSWVDFHRRYCAYDVNLPMKFFWTARGDIDQRKTAIHLVRNSDIEIGIRCAIADIHFIEDFEELKEGIEDIRNSATPEYKGLVLIRNVRELVKSLVGNSNSRSSKILGSCKSELYCAAISGNMAATKYHLEKLTLEVREETLEKTACFIISRYWDHFLEKSVLCSNQMTNVLHLLLSALKTEKRVLLIRNRPLETLRCFLDWPWRYHFQGILKIVVSSFVWKDFNQLLQEIIIWYSRNPTDCKPYFMHIWQEMPRTIKQRSLMDDTHNVLFFRNIFLKEDEDCSTMILKEVIDLVGLEFLFIDAGKGICRNIMRITKDGNLFAFFIRTCLTTIELMIKFKAELVDYVAVCNQSPDENNLESIASECEKAIDLMDAYIEKCEDENNEIRINKVDFSKMMRGKNMDRLS